MKKTLTSALIVAVMTLPSFSPAGVNSGGGGLRNKKDDELLDFSEVKSGALVPFSPSQVAQVQPYLEKVYQRLSQTHYAAMIVLMQEILQQEVKPWFFTSKSLAGTLPTKDLHILTDEDTGEIIAVQDDQKIVVNKPWFDRKINGSPKEQMQAAGLLVHEAVMNIALIAHAPHSGVREVTRALFADELDGNFSARSFHLIVNAQKLDKPIKEAANVHFNILLTKIQELRTITELKIVILALNEISQAAVVEPVLKGFARQIAAYAIARNKGQFDWYNFGLKLDEIQADITRYQAMF